MDTFPPIAMESSAQRNSSTVYEGECFSRSLQESDAELDAHPYIDCEPEKSEVDGNVLLDESSIHRTHYLNHLIAMESTTKDACLTLEQRLITLKRILALNNPVDQLGAYLTFKMEETRKGESGYDDSRIKSALLICAQSLVDTTDEEVALLGANFFIGSECVPLDQGLPSFLQMAVAAQSSGIKYSV